ncbi:hypothetical protein F7725_027287 [Dissostichus mawsoni]|uniref:TGF-beta family profile domain-containing protein n=1 Tax=Dissostichus mawsoni TaxID=36200 RepID=A0A7J5XDE9_DISMA|nr:hypothetical protein F7725_027287 [Dissostichus mawsoni]
MIKATYLAARDHVSEKGRWERIPPSLPPELDTFITCDKDRSDHTSSDRQKEDVRGCVLRRSADALLLQALCCPAPLHGRPPARSPSLTEHTFPTTASTVSHPAPHYAPCFVDDIFAALRESVGNDDELTNSSVYQFGVCTASERSSVLLQLAKETRRNHRDGLEVLPPTGVILAEENERGALLLTFDLPQSPLLKPNPVLLLVFESPLTGGNLDVTFTSQSLHPNTQSVCISEKTQYIMLTGKASEGGVHHRWRMSIETKKPDMSKKPKPTRHSYWWKIRKYHQHDSTSAFLWGRRNRNKVFLAFMFLIDMLLNHCQRDAQQHVSLCFSDIPTLHPRPPHRPLFSDPPEFPALQLDSLDSLPPLTLDLSSSDTLLAELINSSSQTIFSFPSWGSMFQVFLGELAMSPALLQEVKQRLQQTVTQVTEVIEMEGEVGCRAAKRLRRLNELSAFPEKEPTAGESQYRAFLLLRALQTVARGYEMQRSLRSTRDSTDNVWAKACGLRNLTVSLCRHFLGPSNAKINNCHGSCTYPLVNPTNHAELLNSHIENGNVQERTPCCVPTAYDPLDVMTFDEHGTSISIQPNIVAKECGCR